jgi:translation initiation factor IF-2
VPVRIYALAKELGLDNKAMLDICEQLNITGKGSALASLEDAEVDLIKQSLTKKEEVPPAKSAAANPTLAPMKPPTGRVVRKITEITAPVPRGGKQDAGKSLTADAEPGSSEASALSDGSADGFSEQETAVRESAEGVAATKGKGGSLLDRLRGRGEHKDPTAPTGLGSSQPVGSRATTTPIAKPPVAKEPAVSTSASAAASSGAAASPRKPLAPRRPLELRKDASVRNLDQESKKQAETSKSGKPTKAKKSTVSFHLAAMPDVKQPVAKTEPKEKVQKPDIALPQEAIAKARVGAAPLESFTKSAKSKVKKKSKDEVEELDTSETGAAVRRGTRRDRTGAPEGEADLGLRPTRGVVRRGTTTFRRTESRRSSKRSVNTAAPRKGNVVIQVPCTVREFSEATGVPAVKAMLELQKLGSEGINNLNAVMDHEDVEMLVLQMGLEVEIRAAESIEDQIMSMVEEVDDPDTLKPRAPIVTFLGHVDHGKTSLLDALIGINVVAGEAGGITQHIRAYEIYKGDRKIAFVDTPGHEAFTEMRARGANVTDIAVLVVAADDGIMPQTDEAISHIRAAGVPIIVALNKIDLPGVTADKAMQDLAARDLLPSEWGGEVEVVKTSAITGVGLDELLETILFTAEIQNYQANPDRPAFGTCLEAEQQADRGIVAKLMVQGGTLAVGDNVVCGSAFGRVKAIYDTLSPNKKKNGAEPSTPVNVTGFDLAPEAGDKFIVVDDIIKARELAELRRYRGTVERVGGRTTKKSLQDFQSLLESGDLSGGTGEIVTLNLIIRADVRGSIEAIQKELGKISHPEVEIRIIQALPGGISVADVRLADASDAVIVGFNVVADESARSLADELKVEIRRYDVIYKITDDLKATLEGRLKPEEQVVELGMAMILRVFNVSKAGNIAGCRVMRGTIERDCSMRVIRDSRVIGDYPIESLKREKDDAKEVQRGMECGIKLLGFNDIKEGDTLEAYKIKEVARTL